MGVMYYVYIFNNQITADYGVHLSNSYSSSYGTATVEGNQIAAYSVSPDVGNTGSSSLAMLRQSISRAAFSM